MSMEVCANPATSVDDMIERRFKDCRFTFLYDDRLYISIKFRAMTDDDSITAREKWMMYFSMVRIDQIFSKNGILFGGKFRCRSLF